MAVEELKGKAAPALKLLLSGVPTGVDWTGVICPAGLIGTEDIFKLKWFANVIEPKAGQKQAATLAVYSDYRLYPSFLNNEIGRRLITEIYQHITEDQGMGLPERITLVGREPHVSVYPAGYESAGTPSIHYKLMGGGTPVGKLLEPTSDNVIRLTTHNFDDIRDLLTFDINGQTPSIRLKKRIEAGFPYFGVYKEGRLVAMAGCYGANEALEAANLGDIYVRPDMRKKGYGTDVTVAVMHELNGSGINLIACDISLNEEPILSESTKPVAQHLLEKLGMHVTDEILYQDLVRKQT